MLTNFFRSPVILFLFCCSAGCHRPIPEIPTVTTSNDQTPSEKVQPVFLSGSGTLVIPSADIVLITPPAAGVVKSVPWRSGSPVKRVKFWLLLKILNFLNCNSNILRQKASFFYYSEDSKRGGLAIENATSVKKMQQAQRDFQTSEIRFRSLEKQLALIGIDTDSLDADRLSAGIILHSPASGYIDQIAVRPGNQVTAGETIMVIVRKYEPVIAFEMPEEFYSKLKTGNQIEFFFPDDSLVIFKARLTFINRQTDASSHHIKAWATPLKSSSRLVPGNEGQPEAALVGDCLPVLKNSCQTCIIHTVVLYLLKLIQ